MKKAIFGLLVVMGLGNAGGAMAIVDPTSNPDPAIEKPKTGPVVTEQTNVIVCTAYDICE